MHAACTAVKDYNKHKRAKLCILKTLVLQVSTLSIQETSNSYCQTLKQYCTNKQVSPYSQKGRAGEKGEKILLTKDKTARLTLSPEGLQKNYLSDVPNKNSAVSKPTTNTADIAKLIHTSFCDASLRIPIPFFFFRINV